MKTKFIFAAAILSGFCTQAQGTFVYDQQSSADEALPRQGVGWNSIQDFQSGQSFTPTLLGVDFVKLMLNDANPNDGSGLTVHVTLRSGSISGTILGNTDAAFLPNTFAGPGTFSFPTRMQVTPGTTYYLNVVVESGGPFAIFGSGSYNYAGGTAFGGVVPSVNTDLWFREGIYTVPEPCSAALLLLGTFLLAVRRKPST